jgi:hypothetical protein
MWLARKFLLFTSKMHPGGMLGLSWSHKEIILRCLADRPSSVAVLGVWAWMASIAMLHLGYVRDQQLRQLAVLLTCCCECCWVVASTISIQLNFTAGAS